MTIQITVKWKVGPLSWLAIGFVLLMRFVIISLWVFTAHVAASGPAEARCHASSTYGCFHGKLQFKSGWLRQPGQPPRKVLAAPFGYTDPQGRYWKVPAGFATDGASIPKALQPLAGGPWTETYVKAAVLHDYFIRRNCRTAKQVHRLFYDALRAAGTTEARALQLYAAVNAFGPQWGAKLSTRWTRYGCDMWLVWQQRQPQIEAFMREYNAALAQASKEAQRRMDAELSRPPSQRTQHRPVRSSDDLAGVLAEVLKQSLGDNGLNLDNCVLGADGVYDCGALDLRSK